MCASGRRQRWHAAMAATVIVCVLFCSSAEAQSGRGRIGGRGGDLDALEIKRSGATLLTLLERAQEQLKKSAYAEAEQSAREALVLAEQRGNERPIGLATQILGTALFHMGHPAEAETMFRRSLPIREAESGPNHRSVISMMGQLGIVLSQQGKFAEAQPLLEDMLRREETVSRPGAPGLTRAHMHYASVLTFTGKFAAAEEHLRKAIDNGSEATEGANQRLVAKAYHQYAKLLVLSRHSEQALDPAQKSVSLSEKAFGGDSSELARALVVLGQVLVARGAIDQAEPVLAKAAPLSEKLLGRMHPDTASANLMLGMIAERSGHYPQAEAAMKQATESLRQSGPPTQTVSAITNYARFLARRGRDAEALEQYKSALDTVERMYAGTKGMDEESRQAFAGRYAPLYYETVRLLLKMHRANPRSGFDREMLSVVSRTQSRMFAEMLRQADVNRFSSDVGFLQLQKERDSLLERLAQARGTRAARVRIDDPESASENRGFFANLTKARFERIAAESARQISDLEGSLTKVEERLWAGYPRFMELIQPKPFGVAELQRLLAPGEAMLSYFMLQNETVVFAVTATQFAMRPAGMARKELVELVWKARHPAEEVSGSLASLSALDPAVLHRLYQVLVQPVEGLLRNNRKVLVVADGPLYTLPLEMLVTAYDSAERERFSAARAAGKQPLAEYGTLAYLGDRYRFTYLPNLAALASQRLYGKPRVAFERELVSFADPVFARSGKGVVSESTRAMLNAAAGVRRAGSALLPQLPETADEAQGIAKVLGGKTAIYLRDEAQERTAKTADLHATRFVHFATHGLLGGEFLQVKQSLEEEDDALQGAAGEKAMQRNLVVMASSLAQETESTSAPDAATQKGAQPALALSLVDTQGEDGLLTMSEVIENLNLNAELVVLSACNTAGERAEASSGEGFAGLTRAFMYAGARALVVSHWSVDSVSTTLLVTNAFENLKAGQPLDEALARARAKVRSSSDANGSRAHPFFWAPFVQVGD